jgi:hypothetical protein
VEYGFESYLRHCTSLLIYTGLFRAQISLSLSLPTTVFGLPSPISAVSFAVSHGRKEDTSITNKPGGEALSSKSILS